MARGSKLTPARIEKVAESLMLGMTLKLAAARAGVSESTLHAWRARGRALAQLEEESAFEPVDTEPALELVLYRRIEEADAIAAANALAQIAKAAKEGTWQAAAWLLERRFGYIARTEIALQDRTQEIAEETKELDGILADPTRRAAILAAVDGSSSMAGEPTGDRAEADPRDGGSAPSGADLEAHR